MRKLGNLSVFELGFGCMGLSHTYGKSDDAEAIKTIHHAIDRGITLIDTADIYGDGHNEELLGKAIVGRRDKIVLATKFGNLLGAGGPGRGGFDGSPAYAATAIDASLKRLKVDHVDLWYVHRVDPKVPIEDTVGAMAKAMTAGKTRAIGISECSAASLKRAIKVHPIAAVQSELSLWTRDYQNDVLPLCREHGIGFVSYSPLGRGFLAGVHEIAAGDRRAEHPRFAAENMAKNKLRFEAIAKVAAAHKATAAQVALAWVLAQPGVVPIPGTRHIKHLDDNLGALRLKLSPADMAALDEAFPPGSTAGMRYPEGSMKRVNI